jgi:hypothetical protein
MAKKSVYLPPKGSHHARLMTFETDPITSGYFFAQIPLFMGCILDLWSGTDGKPLKYRNDHVGRPGLGR